MMRKIFNAFVEIIFWIAIFASPFLLSLAIGAVIYFSNKNLLWLSILILAIGVLVGIFFAEKIRRKYGCARYMAKLLGTPDIWPDEYPADKELEDTKNTSSKNSSD